MAIVRHRKSDDPFARVSKAILADKRLSWKAKGILAYLMGKPDDWTVRTTDIVKQSPDGKDSVRAAFKEMLKHGYAEVVDERDLAGKIVGKSWMVNDSGGKSATIDGFSGAGFPGAGKSAPTKNDCTENESTKRVGGKSASISLEKIAGSKEAAEIYDAYPSKIARPKALTAIAKAIKKVGAPALLEKTRAFAAARDGDSAFCPYPATWFNQERYNDDPTTWKPRDEKDQRPSLSRNAGTTNAGRASQYRGIGKV